MGIKKGFFFTIGALVLLGLLVLSLQLFVQQKAAEYSSLEDRISENWASVPFQFIDENNLATFTNISAIYATNRLAIALIYRQGIPDQVIAINYSPSYRSFGGVNTPLPADDGIGYVNRSIFELMYYGNTSGYLSDKNIFGKSFYIDGTNLTYLKDEYIYTLSNYFEQTSKLAKDYGYELKWGKIENFSLNQSDYRTIRISYQINAELSSRNSQIKKRLKIKTSFPIDGLPDPYLATRYSSLLNQGSANIPSSNGNDLASPLVPFKNVYFNEKYQNASNVSARKIASGSQGLGWFYGPLTNRTYGHFSSTDPVYNISKISRFIFVTTNESLAREQSQYFGAVILLGHPSYNIISRGGFTTISQEINCIWCIQKTTTFQVDGTKTTYTVYKAPIRRNVPFLIIDPGVFYSAVSLIPRKYQYSHLQGLSYYELKEVLITSDYEIQDICKNEECGQSLELKSKSNPSIYDLSKVRDMAICGYYIKSDYGPSYLQRFTNIQTLVSPPPSFYSLSQEGFGIESFDVGTWSGGHLSSLYNLNDDSEYASRLDYHFTTFFDNYKRLGLDYCRGVFIKGMPGVKDKDMYNSDYPFKNGTGRFALTNLTDNPTFRYGLENLTITADPPTKLRDCK